MESTKNNNKISMKNFFIIPDKVKSNTSNAPKSLNIPEITEPYPFENNSLYKEIKKNLLEDGFSFGDFGLTLNFTKEEMVHAKNMAISKLKNKGFSDSDKQAIINSTKGFCGEFASVKLFGCISTAIGISTTDFEKIIPKISAIKNDCGKDFFVGKTTYSIKSRKDDFARGERVNTLSDIFREGVYTILWSFQNDNNVSEYKLVKIGDEANNIVAELDALKHLIPNFIENAIFAVEKLQKNENPQA